MDKMAICIFGVGHYLQLVCIDTRLRISDAILNITLHSSGFNTVGANSIFLATLHASTWLQSTHFLGVFECASRNVKFSSSGHVNVYRLRSALHMLERRRTSMQ